MIDGQLVQTDQHSEHELETLALDGLNPISIASVASFAIVRLRASGDRRLRPVKMSLEKSLQLRADQFAGGASGDYFCRAGSFGDIL